jgi:hypothetical protein
LRQKLAELQTAKDVSAVTRLSQLRKRVDAIKASDAEELKRAEGGAAGGDANQQATASSSSETKQRLDESALAKLREAMREKSADEKAMNFSANVATAANNRPVKLRDFVRQQVQTEMGVQLSARDFVDGSRAKALDEGDVDDNADGEGTTIGKKKSQGLRSGDLAGAAAGADSAFSGIVTTADSEIPLGLQPETSPQMLRRRVNFASDDARRKRKVDRLMDF